MSLRKHLALKKKYCSFRIVWLTFNSSVNIFRLINLHSHHVYKARFFIGKNSHWYSLFKCVKWWRMVQNSFYVLIITHGCTPWMVAIICLASYSALKHRKHFDKYSSWCNWLTLRALYRIAIYRCIDTLTI